MKHIALLPPALFPPTAVPRLCEGLNDVRCERSGLILSFLLTVLLILTGCGGGGGSLIYENKTDFLSTEENR
ncbi:MAG: hypothetical protein OXC68_11145, partial [Aestuariivita sp.]|nr:hypothetical protein [Aestuariivita sp.]